MMVFGFPLERMREIAARHRSALARSEMVAMDPLETDDDVSPDEFEAFLKFRAVVALRSAFGSDAAGFQRAAESIAALGAELVL